MCFKGRSLTVIIALFVALSVQAAERLVYDAHIHYSHDVWDVISPTEAVTKLRTAGISRALVSSSGTGGARKLFEADPDLVIPALRPYRRRGSIGDWMYDKSVIPYLKSQLDGFGYVAIGEFHLSGAEADLPVVRQVVELARQHGLMLHVHSDADAIDRLFMQDPDARILWAHAGFEEADTVRAMLDTYPNLWADLSFRYDVSQGGRLQEGWRSLFIEHADRFMLGADTYEPRRWLEIPEVMAWQHTLLDVLPKEVADRIAYQNFDRVIVQGYPSLD
ncbi:MAG: hypothetical protein BMS9Abin15_0795 [Gammaproteobacteria bacterium]|nr:MAG: hypothetical protein BMS9Abin15_0795 [Gammaproteobacteria bacterium]